MGVTDANDTQTGRSMVGPFKELIQHLKAIKSDNN
jgi:hypothetical protein